MLSSIRLQNFRSYKNTTFEFNKTANIIVGANGSGKTNLLEAVQVLATGKSFRLPLSKLVKKDKKWARLDGWFGSSTRILKLTETGSEFLIDNQSSKRLPARLMLPVVLFEPNHLMLINGEPAGRRSWLDGIVEALEPQMKKTLNNYQRALAQRNRLLKQKPADIKRQIFAWDIRLSELAGLIALKRQSLINEINKQINQPYSHIAGRRQVISLEYLAQFNPANYSSQMLSKLGASLNQDKERGFTSHGPHREDVEFYLNGRRLSEAASRGESRSFLISLKILEKDLLEKTTQEKPLLLLDDVFSELDAARRHGLVDYLKDYQIILTTTDADAVITYFGKKPNLISL